MLSSSVRPCVCAVCLFTVLALMPGCFLIGPYPGHREAVGRDISPPRAVSQSFVEMMPDAQDVTFYSYKVFYGGLFGGSSDEGYRAHFQMNGQWFLVDLDDEGVLVRFQTSDADFDG